MPRKKKVSKEEEPVVEVVNVVEEEPVVEVEEVKEAPIKSTGKFEAVNGSLISPDGRVLESGLAQDRAEQKADRFNKK